MVLARTAKTRGGTLWDRKPKSPGPLTSILEQQHCHNDAREWEEASKPWGDARRAWEIGSERLTDLRLAPHLSRVILSDPFEAMAMVAGCAVTSAGT